VLVQIAFASLLVLATVLIHAICTAGTLGWLRSIASHHWVLRNTVTRAAVLAGVVFLMLMAAFLEAGLWALLYVGVGELPDLEDALYFSLVTFTTLGYGDLTLKEEWRILGAFQAANGVIMFGWTTALIVAVAHRLFIHHESGEIRSTNS